jgi:hypothetical protein
MIMQHIHTTTTFVRNEHTQKLGGDEPTVPATLYVTFGYKGIRDVYCSFHIKLFHLIHQIAVSHQHRTLDVVLCFIVIDDRRSQSSLGSSSGLPLFSARNHCECTS